MGEERETVADHLGEGLGKPWRLSILASEQLSSTKSFGTDMPKTEVAVMKEADSMAVTTVSY